MKIREKMKRVFRRPPRTLEQLAARAEAEARKAAAEGDATASHNNMTGPYSGF